MALKRQAVELERLRLACQVSSVETIPKAQEILRLMDSKCRPGALGRGDMCRTLVAFDLACRALSCPIPPKTAAKLSGSPSEAVYVAAVGTAQRLLGVQRRYTCQEIAESVGGKRVGTMAATELKRYKERFLASHPAKQVASIDLDGTVYAVSAFYLCAKKLKHPVDKQQLLDLSLVREAEFTAVCRSMLELCYSTLGVSVSDKPSAERLAQFSKAAALGSNHTDRPSSAAGAAGGDNALATASAAVTSTPLSRRGAGGAGGAGAGGRRPIPLSGGRGGPAAPRSHMAALARSIQAASRRKRYGGTTIALAEPGGSNEANDALHDRTHRPAATKRPRCPTPTATAPADTITGATSHRSGGAASASASGTNSTATAAHLPSKPPRVVVKNPYATASTASAAAAASGEIGRSGTSSSAATAHPPSSATVIPRAAIRNPYAIKKAAVEAAPAACSPSSGASRTGQEGEGDARKAGEYAAWKERVLASMENKISDKNTQEEVCAVASSSSATAITVAPTIAPTARTGADAAVVSDAASTADTAQPAAVTAAAAKKSAQPCLTSFFAPKGQENATI